MEKRSRRRVPELVTRLAFQGLSENEIGRARISMMARNANVPFKGRIQKRKTYHLQINTFGLQCAAGPQLGHKPPIKTRPALAGCPLRSDRVRTLAPQRNDVQCHKQTSAALHSITSSAR